MTTYLDISTMDKDQICEFITTLKANSNCEGTLEECLMSGWINAMDVNDEVCGNMTSATFAYYTLSDAENMHGRNWKI